MTNEQVGIYVKLLCAQHQHGGLIDTVSFHEIVGEHEIIKRKFLKTDDGFLQRTSYDWNAKESY